MNVTKRKPPSVAEILKEEFMAPLKITQAELAEAMGVSRKHVNELCNNRRTITVDTAFMLANVFDTSEDFWLNLQRVNSKWDALHDPKRRQRIERTKQLKRKPRGDKGKQLAA